MIRLAIIGTGSMANAHADAFSKIEGCEVVTCSDIVPGRAREFADRHAIPTAYEDTNEMLDKEKLDAVTVVASDDAHMQCSLMAIQRGLHTMCEKPLATSLAEAREMADAARKAGVLTAVNFSYRNSGATQKAAEIIASGAIGRIIHVEGAYLQSWISSKYWGDWHTKEAFLWRMSTKRGSLGVLGDIGVHLYDLVTFVAGDISEIACDLRTFEKDVSAVGEYVLDANESMVANVRFAAGGIGTLHTSRWATGHANTVAMSVYGDKGAIDLNLDRPAPETLKVCLGDNVDKLAWVNVECPDTPNMYQRFVDSIRTGKQGQTSFEGAVKVQACLEASLKSWSESGSFVRADV